MQNTFCFILPLFTFIFVLPITEMENKLSNTYFIQIRNYAEFVIIDKNCGVNAKKRYNR